MAQYYATVQGVRGSTATKTGTKDSGLRAHVRGWSTGARIMLSFDKAAGCDRVQVWRTAGSNSGAADVLIAEWLDTPRAPEDMQP